MSKFVRVQIFAVLITAVSSLWALKCGTLETSWSEVWAIFTGSTEPLTVLLRELRLGRVILALLAGAALGVSGTILQKILHNDLAAPEIIGISSGAGCAGLLLLFFFPESINLLGVAAFAGGMLAAVTVYLAAWKQGVDPARLVLSGVAISTLFGAFTAMMMMLNSGKLVGIFEFTLGGVSGKGLVEVRQSLPFFAAVFICAALMKRRLDILSLDDSSAASLGINVELFRLTALALAALAAATAVSVSGLLGFVGLMSPHIARKLGSGSAGKQLLLAGTIGACLCVTGEWLGRIAAAPRELPAGVFLSAAGAVFFLILLLGHRRDGI